MSESEKTRPIQSMPRILPGMAWNPREQCRAFTYSEIGVFTLTTDGQIIAPGNACRQALIIEWIGGGNTMALRIDDCPVMNVPGTSKIGLDPLPLCISAHDYPGVPQNQWSAASSDSVQIRVWEFVAKY